MYPHIFRGVDDSILPILWNILGVQESMLKKFWNFLLRATKFSAQIWKTVFFNQNHIIHLSGHKMCRMCANKKKNVGRPEYKYICPYYSILIRRGPLPAEKIRMVVPIGSQKWPQKKISYMENHLFLMKNTMMKKVKSFA